MYYTSCCCISKVSVVIHRPLAKSICMHELISQQHMIFWPKAHTSMHGLISQLMIGRPEDPALHAYDEWWNAFTYSAFYLPSAITWAVQYDDCPPSVEPPAAWAVRWILGGTTLSLDVRIHWRCRIGHEASCFHGVSHYYYRLDQIKLAIKSIQRGTCRCIVDPVVGFVPWEKVPLWLSRWLVLICCNEKYS